MDTTIIDEGCYSNGLVSERVWSKPSAPPLSKRLSNRGQLRSSDAITSPKNKTQSLLPFSKTNMVPIKPCVACCCRRQTKTEDAC